MSSKTLETAKTFKLKTRYILFFSPLVKQLKHFIFRQLSVDYLNRKSYNYLARKVVSIILLNEIIVK